MPDISIIIPNYNHGYFLKQRIESVLNQTYKNFECIILDDASSDNSQQIILQYAAQDSRISYNFSQVNSGSPFVQWNKGVQLAKNELIWIAESDDYCLPTFLEDLVQSHKNNTSICLSYCQSNKVNIDGVIVGSWSDQFNFFDVSLFKNDFIIKGEEFVNKFLIKKNVIPNASAVLFKKSAYQRIGGADENFKTNSDWLVWLKMSLIGDVAFLASHNNMFRFHSQSVIAKHNASIKSTYKEQYDCKMRKAFKAWYKTNYKLSFNKEIIKVNDQFISYDIGNEGLYLALNKHILNGLFKILVASFFPKLTTGYFRKILKNIK